MKTWKKMFGLVLAMVMVLSCVAGCGDKGKDDEKGGNTEKDIQIAYSFGGLGTDFLDALIEGFEAKYPEYNVYYDTYANNDATTAAFGLAETDTNDIYMAINPYNKAIMEPLDDMLDSTIEAEGVTVREKILPAYMRLETAADGKVYSLTKGGGILSIVYNKNLFEEAGIRTLPRTTDELASVCDALAANDITPFMHFQTSGYWDFMSEVFFMQYDGLDYVINDFYCGEPSLEKFTKEDGRYEALKAYEKFITPDYILSGSNSNDHITMQTEFLAEKAAMMVNGSWLSNEMESLGVVDGFEMMKTPVISSITDKLTTVTKETDLRKVISAIDSVTDGEKELTEYQTGDGYLVDGLKVSAEDWDYVKKARNTMATNYSGGSMFIPSYSNAKEGAKEFMKYMYSDEGYKVYADTLHIALPIKMTAGEIDTTDWNDYEKNQFDLFNKAEQFATEYVAGKHAIFYDGGARTFAGWQYINRFCTNNVSDLQNATQAWQSIVDRINNDYENNWMANIK